MEAEQKKEAPKKTELDQNSRNLINLWRTLNHDQKLPTELGPIEVKIIANALVRGIKIGQIEFVWQKEKKPSPPQVRFDEIAKKITLVIDQHSLDALENDLDAIMPGGVVPVLAKNPGKVYEDLLKKAPAEKRTHLPHLAPISQTFLLVYRHYLSI